MWHQFCQFTEHREILNLYFSRKFKWGHVVKFLTKMTALLSLLVRIKKFSLCRSIWISSNSICLRLEVCISFIVKRTQRTCMHNYEKAVENKHLYMKKNNDCYCLFALDPGSEIFPDHAATVGLIVKDGQKNRSKRSLQWWYNEGWCLTVKQQRQNCWECLCLHTYTCTYRHGQTTRNL